MNESDVDHRLLDALGDPKRYEVLLAIAERPDSVRGIAARLERAPADVRRHISELLAGDAIEPLEPGGADHDERGYRSMIRPLLDDAHWERLPPERRRQLFEISLRRLSERIDDALAVDGFGHVQTHVSFTRLLLDDQGWQEMADLLAGVVEEAMQIEAEAAQRRSGAGADAFHTNLAMLHFGRADAGVRASRDQLEG